MAESVGVAPTRRSSFPAMGTHVDVIGWGGDGMAIINTVVGVVARHEDMWSVFRSSFEVSRLNAAVASIGCGDGASRCEADSAVVGLGLAVSEETDRLLRDALALVEATGEAFNPLIGPPVAAWDVKSVRAAYVMGASLPLAPSERVVEVTLRVSSWGLLSHVGERHQVMGLPGESVGGVNMPSPSLDLDGIAKGCTADACHDLAAAVGARGVLVSVGTSSVLASGTHADGSSWRAGLCGPQGGPTSVAGIVELSAGGMTSLSTSGDNLGPLDGVRVVCVRPAVGSAVGPLVEPAADRRARETSREAFVDGGRVFDHHIIDPRTGYPVHAGMRQVSVVASPDVLAEAPPTILFVDPSINASDVVARWSRLSGALTSTRVAGIVCAEQG